MILDKLARPAQLSSMEKRAFSGREILTGQAPDDAPVTVKGWVRTRRGLALASAQEERGRVYRIAEPAST